jgi:hypothetical protein
VSAVPREGRRHHPGDAPHSASRGPEGKGSPATSHELLGYGALHQLAPRCPTDRETPVGPLDQSAQTRIHGETEPPASVIGMLKTGAARQRGSRRILDSVEFATLGWAVRLNYRRLLEPNDHVSSRV